MIITASARVAKALDPSAADVPGPFNALYVGVTGDVSVVTLGGDIITFTNVPVGFFPVTFGTLRSLANGTTALGLIGLSW